MARHGVRNTGSEESREELFQLLADLGYADDLGLIDECIAEASRRVSSIEVGSLLDADMVISRPKTECMHVGEQVQVPPARAEEYAEITGSKGMLSFLCPHCGVGFDTKQGRSKHITSHCAEARRESCGVYEVERVVDARGAPLHRYYLVKWSGWGAEHNTWEPWRHMVDAGVAVDEYFERSGASREAELEAPGEHRCRWCNKFFTSSRAAATLKAHYTRGCGFEPKSRVGSRAEKAVKRHKIREAQKGLGDVLIGGCKLNNVYEFKYLGNWFTADGDRRYAVNVRMAQARTRFGQLHNIWGSSSLPLSAKIRLFEASVASVLLYGCEVWVLDDKQMATLHQWCARCMAHITKREVRDEYNDPTYPLVMKARQRRLRWLGHVLRMGEHRLVRVAVVSLTERVLRGESEGKGTVIMDAPGCGSVDELVELAQDRQLWNGMCNALCPKQVKRNKRMDNNSERNTRD